MTKTNKWFLFFAFVCGLWSSLFIPTPFGRIAMFDLACYFLAPFVFIVNRKSFTRQEHRLLFFALLWLFGAIWSNWWRGENFNVALKGNAIVFNVWCMIVVSFWLLKRSYKTFLWFAVGAGFSSVISLYVFQNGSYLFFAENAGYSGRGGMQDFLAEKQIIPLYVKMFFQSILFPLKVFIGIPWLPVIGGLVSVAFYMLFVGGSRSGFGIALLNGFFMGGYAYFRGMVNTAMKNFLVWILLGGLLGFGIFKTYTYLASTGALGEKEYQKYLREMVDSESGVLGSRDDIIRAWPFLKNHPIVGAGSSRYDQWGYIKDSEDGLIPGHSAVVAAWTQNGVFGLIFWLYALYLIFVFLRIRMICFRSWTPFLFSMCIGMTWSILFSPFGGYRGTVSFLLAFCAACQSREYADFASLDIASGKNQFTRRRGEQS